MDDLTLLRSFRAERADGDPRARDAARRALQARFESASTAPEPSLARAPRRRRLVALAGIGAVAAIVAGVLLISSGPSAEPAAAEVLRQTAAVAATTETPAEAPPGPGQFLYGRTKSIELEGWVRGGGPVSRGGPLNAPNAPNAFIGLVPMESESWTSPDGSGRTRETLGTPRFFSSAERSRWEQAGSPLPGSFDESDQDTETGWFGHLTDIGGHILQLSRGVIDTEHPKMEGFKFPDPRGLPTEPEALRRAVQNHLVSGPWNDFKGPGAPPLGNEETIWGLWGILGEAISAPPLRSAAFDALAEMPGIELDRGASDLLGRAGYAISYLDPETGIRIEYIFDPETSAILGTRSVFTEPGGMTGQEGIPAGTTMRDAAILRYGVVDSTGETPDAAADGGPAATTGPVYRR